MVKITRRDFVKTTLAVAGGAALAPAVTGLLQGQTQAQASEDSTTRKVRKWVFIIDLSRCDGCRKCTEACQKVMLSPPAWGEPNYKGKQAWIHVFEEAPGKFIPVLCQNCQNSPCAKVCPVGATFYSEDHIVLIDQDRCIGCRICMAACPYQRRFFNWFDPPALPEEEGVAYTPDTNIPHRRGVVEKCIWCRHRVNNGELPACLEACTQAGMKAIYFGDTNEDAVTNGEDIVRISELLEKSTLERLKEDLGTEPSVYYLPNRRVEIE